MWAMRKWQQLFPMCLAVSAKSTHVLVRLVHLQNPRLVAWASWRAWHNQARKHFELKLAAKLWEYVEMVPATSKRLVYRHPLPSIKTPSWKVSRYDFHTCFDGLLLVLGVFFSPHFLSTFLGTGWAPRYVVGQNRFHEKRSRVRHCWPRRPISLIESYTLPETDIAPENRSPQ